MTTSSFHGDRPIESAEQDRFGFGPLADRVAEALTTQAAGKGFVLGVEGKWGSGKSSLLALVVAKLRGMDQSKVAVVEFRPWLVGDRNQLLASLFEDLVKAIAGLENAGGDATGTSMITAKEVAEKARRFAGHLGPVGKLAGLAGLAIPGAAIFGKVLEGLAAAAKDTSEGPTLAAQKDDLSVALVKLDCRIVVTIDDVDRLEPREVGELLRLVRSVADFPNVSYLLCYDATILKHAVEKATGVGDGSAYLEKIVQTEIGVPLPESFALRRWFTAELEALAECEPRRVPDLLHVINETGGRGFDTARSVVRVLDSLRAYWPSLNGRVDLVDLVWLRIIAVTDRPHASDAITDRATFDTVRSIMVRRYAAGGLDRILGERNAITILYAWSQAGGRDEVVKAVAERTAEDRAFVELMLKICSTSVSSSGANLSLSLEAVHNFFDSPPEVVDRLMLSGSDAASKSRDARAAASMSGPATSGNDVVQIAALSVIAGRSVNAPSVVVARRCLPVA
jgi:hypothetical protein